MYDSPLYFNIGDFLHKTKQISINFHEVMAICPNNHSIYGHMRREGLCVKIHIVQKGDTLWKIAKKYGVNFESLKKVNSQLSNPDMLMPGMKIKVPENTSAPLKKGGDTKVNFGTVKEAPISGGGATMKESIKPETQAVPSKPKEKPIVKPPAVKEMPIQSMETKKEKPVKEKPKMPYVAPQASVKPVIPEIDINNYYLMNMSKMEVQTPPPMPIIKEAPKVKEKPVKEQPIVKEQPKKQMKPMPMPQYDYCPPMMPYYDPCCQPMMMHPCMPYPTPYYSQPYMTGPVYHHPSYYQQPYWGHGDQMDDCSSFHYGHHESTHMMDGQKGEHHSEHTGYYPSGTMSSYGQYPMQYTHGYYQHPHYGFESSPYGMESPTHMMDHHHQQYIPFDGYIPQGCGCNDTSTGQGTYYQPMTHMTQQGQDMSQQMAQKQQQSQGMGQSMNQYLSLIHI